MRRLVAVAGVLLAVAAAAQTVTTEPRETLRFGVVSFYNPRLMYLKYQPLIDYLSERTPWTWELVVSAAYEPTVEQLCTGAIAAGYLGPFTFERARARCGVEAIARLNTHGKATYQSYVMVRGDAAAMAGLTDLRGKRVAFGAPLSTSSHLVPRAMLLRAGLAPGRDYKCDYLWHHERAARAVLLGDVDACGIRDILGEKFLDRGLRVLARSEPIPNFPIAVAPASPAAVREALVRALVVLPRSDPAIAAAMAGWDEEIAAGFSAAAASDYEPIRALALEVFGARVFSLPENELACSRQGP